MPAVAIDTHKLFKALKSTGKNENFSAEDLASAFDAAQGEGDLVTRSYFDARMAVVDANGVAIDGRMTALEGRMHTLEGRMDTLDGRMGALDGRMARVEARLERIDARIDVFDAKLDTMRAEMRVELKSGQLQTFYWLAGIVLISNGAVIALLGRVARLY